MRPEPLRCHCGHGRDLPPKTALSRCLQNDNIAITKGHAVYANSLSATSFFSCSFGGDHGDDECVIDSDGNLELYYTQAFSNGTVCSDATTAIVVYNGDAVVPFSSSSSADLLSCQDESIGLYCAFDCTAGLGGVGIECR